ncbi:hypothetical protein BKA69DRAFT_1049725 [Paraphysoderma sedebokerense]|nr:hypothetical protein BKA69DRAFT_1049725 [Paraphysoderma sedebokerense]
MDSFKAKEFWTVVVGGTTLSTIAGFINAISLAGLFTSTVSHVTGNVTRIGLTLLAGDFWQCAIISSLVLSFMAGSFTSGFMIGNSKFQLGRKYGFALLIEAGALVLSYMLLRKEFVTGELLAAYACGLQNAMATSYSGAVLRTTHMTGICTDIGLILGQACSKRGTADTWKLKVFVPLFFGYVGGGILGQVSYSPRNKLGSC